MGRIVVFLCLGMTILIACEEKKTAFIDFEYVYERIAIKEHFQTKLEAALERRESTLDSLRSDLIVMESKTTTLTDQEQSIFQQRVANFERLAQEFYDHTAEQRDEYKSKVIKYINEGMKEFGDQHDFQYIFGATGNGVLMYAKKQHDISDEIIDYLNKRYQDEL